MATTAAYFAYLAYWSARDDASRLEQRAAEQSHLNLLERRFDVLDRARARGKKLTNDNEEPLDSDLVGQRALNGTVIKPRQFTKGKSD